MLQAVTLAGNAGSGLYYSFSKKDDIAPAIGDCLGVVSKVCAYPQKEKKRKRKKGFKRW
jgi:hypothetical protein